MARRDRVPRHKSHNHKRNKNAKLSPFQREQKRAKMANQVPTATTMGSLDSVPHSQRHVFDYLQERLRKQREKRVALELARQQETEDGTAAHTADASSSSSEKAKRAAEEDNTEAAAQQGDAAPAAASKRAKKVKMAYASLNEELTASVGTALQPLTRRHRSKEGDEEAKVDGDDANAPRTVEEIIARKKERKHKRKQEVRRARVAAQLQEIEEQLDDYVRKSNSVGKKKGRKEQKGGADGTAEQLSQRDRVTVGFERQLRKMQKDELAAEAARQWAVVEAARAERETEGGSSGKKTRKRRRASKGEDGDDGEGDGGEASTTHAGDHADTEAAPRPRKRISFDSDVPDPTAEQAARRAAAKKPQDFYELVDVVRYGERVDAPPVFDVVPNRHAAVSRLANQLEREQLGARGHRNAIGADERHRLLSGGGTLGEQKRLARMGLAPAITHTVRPDASAAARMSKEEEIRALRDRVMATYQRNRKKDVTERKGVDMHHEFPKFA